MNANIKRTPRRRKDVAFSAPSGELPLSSAETDISAPSHSTPQPSPKSGEASAAQETGLAAESSSPAPGASVGPASAPVSAAHVLAAPSNEGADSVGAGAGLALESPVRTALAVVSAQVDAIQAMDMRVGELESRYTGVIFQVETTGGMTDAKKAREEIRESRYALQNLLRDGKVPVNNLKRYMEETTTARIDRLLGVETPIDSQIKGEEQRKADEKKAREEAEQRRKDAIEARIEEIRNRATEAMGKPSADIAALIEQTTAIAIDDTFAELKSKAESVQKMTLDKLRYFHQAALDSEEKARELAEQEKRLAAERESQRLRERRMEAINDINGLVVVAARGRTLATYDSVIERLEQRQITAEEFGDLVDTAIAARDNTLAAVRLDRDALAAQLEQEVEAKRKRIAAEAETARLAEQKREQDRQAHEADEARKLRDKRIGDINFIRAVVGMSASLETVAEFDSVIEDTKALNTSVSAYGDLSSEATSARDSTLEILQARRDLLAHRLELEATAASREAVTAPTDPAEATDGELLSSATLFGDAVSAELPPEPDAPSVDEAILTTLDLLSMEYGLDDVRGKELIVRMGARVTELAA